MRIKVIKTERDWERANQTEMKRILKKIRELELSEDLNLSIPLRDLKVQFNQLARINKRLGKNKELSYRQNAMFTDNLLTLLNLLLKIVELAQYDDSE